MTYPSNQSVSSQLNKAWVNPGILQSGAIGAQTLLAQSVYHEKKYHIMFSERMAGKRVPVIDKKLAQLFTHVQDMKDENSYLHVVPGDVAIDVLGNYNPIYSGRPKKLSRVLLDALAGFLPMKQCYGLWRCGLVYSVPALMGVRGQRARVTPAGLALLDHWAVKFPKFSKFLLAYDNNKARREIMSECFDLAMGIRPQSYHEIDKLNTIYQVKWEARQYREMKKKEARVMAQSSYIQHNQIAMSQHQQLLEQAQAAQHYNNSLYGSSSSAGSQLNTINPPGIFKRVFGDIL